MPPKHAPRSKDKTKQKNGPPAAPQSTSCVKDRVNFTTGRSSNAEIEVGMAWKKEASAGLEAL